MGGQGRTATPRRGRQVGGVLRWELRLPFTKIVADRDLSSLQWRRACGLRPDVELRDGDVGSVRCVIVYFFVCLCIFASCICDRFFEYDLIRAHAVRSSKFASVPCLISWIPVVTLVKACAVCISQVAMRSRHAVVWIWECFHRRICSSSTSREGWTGIPRAASIQSPYRIVCIPSASH